MLSLELISGFDGDEYIRVKYLGQYAIVFLSCALESEPYEKIVNFRLVVTG
jgi:hypothetical protein